MLSYFVIPLRYYENDSFVGEGSYVPMGKIGRYGENLSDARFRNAFDYIVASYFIELQDQLVKEGKSSIQYLREIRRNWTTASGDRLVDSARRKMVRNADGQLRPVSDLKPSNIRNLLLSLELEDYGRFGTRDNISLDEIKDAFKEYSSNFSRLEQMGLYPHSTFDPELNSVVFPELNTSEVRSVFFTTRGKSLRDLEPNEQFEILNHDGSRTLYVGTLPSAEILRKREEAYQQRITARPQQQQNRGQNQQRTFGNAPIPNQTRNRNQQNQNQNTNSIANETFLGWDGDEKKKIRGLKHVLGAYLSRSDLEKAKNMINPQQKYSGENIEKSVELLRHLRSHGYDFSVIENDFDNQLNIRLDTGNRVEVRVVDTDENQQYIGRVYDTYNMYYHYVQGSQQTQRNFDHSAEGVISIIDFVEGRRTGNIRKTASSDNTQVRFDDIHKTRGHWLVAKPSDKYGIDDRYDSLIFADDGEAKDYLKESIRTAKTNVARAFNIEDVLALVDYENIVDEDTDEFTEFMEEQFDKVLSSDDVIRRAQEEAIRKVHEAGLERSRDRRKLLEQELDAIIGDYENGFNPSLVLDYMDSSGRSSERDAMLTALRHVNYDLDKIKGNEFGVNQIKERLVRYDEKTGKTIDEVEHPMIKKALETVETTLDESGFRPVDSEKGYDIKIDDNGVIRWEAERRLSGRKERWQKISGEIGQVMVPDEHGIIKTKFLGDNNYGFVPGYTGYFAFDGEYGENRMERFRVKGFEEHLVEQIRGSIAHQATRPYNEKIGNIPQVLDSSRLNSLYHGDVYGRRIDMDFMETNQLPERDKLAILQSLRNRVRFDNQYSDHATTSAETRAERAKYQQGQGLEDSAAFSYWEAAGGKNMRVLQADMENYADLVMTGSGKTQGLIWYLVDGAKVQDDGKVIPSEGILKEDGTVEPDKTAIRKLPYFELEKHNAWDRNQMSANDLITALHVDNPYVAFISFGGWTFDDGFAVSKEYAERNKVLGKKPNEESKEVLQRVISGMADGSIEDYQGARDFLKGSGMIWSEQTLKEGAELYNKWYNSTDSEEQKELRQALDEYLDEHGRFRPLQRGDKISDFGGNKGTISMIFDRNMSLDEAKKQGIEREVAFFKANPELDVIGGPYSFLSRHNAAVIKQMMKNPKDLINPETGEIIEAGMARLPMMVHDNTVDSMTHAYSREDILEGKGRKVSGQLAWALQSKGAKHILDEVYGNNDNAWATFREYLIVTGLDMKPNGTIIKGYEPHHGEERETFEYKKDQTEDEFLNKIKDSGGFLKLPFNVTNRAGDETNKIPILSASLREDTELVDGSMRRNDFTNSYLNIYRNVGAYYDAVERIQKIENGEIKPTRKNQTKESMIQEAQRDLQKAQRHVETNYNKIQDTIIDRQFNGSHNGKFSYIREHIMGKRMKNSATGVAIADPRLNIGEAGMNSDMMKALNVKEGDTVMMFRDPVWRDGAIRAMTVVKDDSVNGVAFNPITDKSHDGDFDGDTMGLIKLNSKEAIQELKEKFSHSANMIDVGDGNNNLYFQKGMDLATGLAVAKEKGDDRPFTKIERVETLVEMENSPKHLELAQKEMNEYAQILFREHSFYGDYINLSSDETVVNSLVQMAERGAKGSQKKNEKTGQFLTVESYMKYHNGEMDDNEARRVQYATGVKVDDTGLAGSFGQKLVSVMRNHNIQAALESMYPITQGTLQIKHDPEHAREVNRILTDDLNRLFRGKHLVDIGKEAPLTKQGFINEFIRIMNEDMGVDVNEEFVKQVAETLSVNNQVKPLKEVMEEKGAPMDRVAYGGGFEALLDIANEGRSLLEGEYSEMFAPRSMRNANKETVIVKQDVLRKQQEENEMTLDLEEVRQQVKKVEADRVVQEIEAEMAEMQASSASPKAFKKEDVGLEL